MNAASLARVSAVPVLMFALSSSGQNSSQDLPTAPSTTLQQQQQASRPKPLPTAQDSTPKPSPSPSPSEGVESESPASAPSASQAQKPSEAPPAPPQAPPKNDLPDADDPSITRIIKTIQETAVIFTVTDKHGRFIKNLTQTDFTVLDDGHPPDAVRSFSSQSDLPLRVGLLIDASNSIRDRFKFEQEAAAEFLSQIIRPKGDEAFVIGFDSTPEVTADFTENTEKLTHGIHMLRPGGGTAVYDAIYYACRDKLMKHADHTPTRRAIILISDGEDNQSHVTREEAIEMAQHAEAIIYTISTNVSGTILHGDKVMQRIAEATGGKSFNPFRIQDVSNAFTEIQEELRSQYLIAYKPANFQADGRYRSIQIASKDKKLKVRARLGYYAPAPAVRTTAETH